MGSTTRGIVLLTGGSKGFGRQLARMLLDSGFTVVIVSRTKTADPVLRQAVEGGDDRVMEVTADITDRDGVRRVVRQTLDRYGRLDALINNAGIKLWGEFTTIPSDRFYSVMATNLMAPIWLCYEVLPVMRRQGFGRIVNVGSRAGLRFNGTGTAYCSSKAGLTAFSQALADDCRGTGITVNLLAPPTLTSEQPDFPLHGAQPRAMGPEPVMRVILGLLRPDCTTTGRVFAFHTPLSLLKSVLLDLREYSGHLAGLRHRI